MRDRAGEVAKRLLRPLIPEAVAVRRYTQRFFATTAWKNLHLGVFESFAAAREFVAGRGTRPSYSIDHEAWLEKQGKLSAHDYAPLFWLGHAATAGCRVFDIGGSVGVTYLAYKKRLPLLAEVAWEVCELPDVVIRGAALAEKLDERALTFTTDMTRSDGCDVLFSAGALQFIEEPIDLQLERVTSRPRHVLINRLPVLADHPTFVTLQNTGQSIAPCRVEHESSFFGRMSRLGYRLADRWKCFENSMTIPFHTGLHMESFQGFYFVRES
ncbi:MAG: methyltransferase, TIGR04325 family [Deltaproteobacteria bacterium]